jgi:hypothetical protein
VGEVRVLSSRKFEFSYWSDRFVGPTAATLILSSFAINLGLGRWGSYLGTSIQGFYLPDLFLIVGAVLSLTQWRKARLLPKTALIFALPLLYLLLQTIHLVIRVPSSGYTNWVRDMAPFAYLSLVPLVALSLALLKPQVLVLVVRWSSIVYAIPYAANQLGLTPPWVFAHVISDSVPIFSYRGDFTGFALGIGIVAWGRWGFGLNRNILIQGCLLAVGLLESSVAALVTLLTLFLLSVLKDWSISKVGGAVKLLLTSLIAVTLLALASAPSAPNPSVNQTGGSPFPWFTTIPAFEDLSNLLSEGTTRARIITWNDVWRYLATGTNWVFGGGPGTDTLYFACTGIQIAPEKLIQESNGEITYLPKCGIDSSESFTTLRDPHNWALNLWLYHGIVGLLVFMLVLLVPLWTLRSLTNYWLSVFGVLGILLVASFGVILSAPFGLVPLTVFLGYLYANRIRHKSLLD